MRVLDLSRAVSYFASLRFSREIAPFTGLVLLVLFSMGKPLNAESSPASAGTNDESRLDVVAQWEGAHSEVASADIRYLRVMVYPQEETFRPDDVAELLTEIEYAQPKIAAEEVLKALQPELLGEAEEMAERREYAVSPQRLLLLGDFERSYGRESEHLSEGPIHLYRDNLNHNIRAYTRGRCPLWFQQLEWFRKIPSADAFPEEAWVEITEQRRRIGLPGADHALGTWLEINPSDGMPLRWNLVDPTSGELTRISLYDEYTVWPGDVSIPVMRAQVNVRNGWVTNVLMTIVEEAKFNIDLPESMFNMQAPQRWTWHDFRNDFHPGGTFTEPVQDVVEFFRSRSPEPPPLTRAVARQASEGWTFSSLWKPLLLILNGLLLVGLGVFLWRRPV